MCKNKREEACMVLRVFLFYGIDNRKRNYKDGPCFSESLISGSHASQTYRAKFLTLIQTHLGKSKERYCYLDYA